MNNYRRQGSRCSMLLNVSAMRWRCVLSLHRARSRNKRAFETSHRSHMIGGVAHWVTCIFSPDEADLPRNRERCVRSRATDAGTELPFSSKPSIKHRQRTPSWPVGIPNGVARKLSTESFLASRSPSEEFRRRDDIGISHGRWGIQSNRNALCHLHGPSGRY